MDVWGKSDTHLRVLVAKHEEKRDHFEDLGMNERTVLKQFLEKGWEGMY
jgi:hypothetical protein